MLDRVLVTGGLGFIGAAFVRRLVVDGVQPVVVDLDTYAGDERRLEEVASLYRIYRMDVADAEFARVVARERPQVIVHFAAESHVTRGESAARVFYRTNVAGTQSVLDAADRAGVSLVVHVSTDEVYGPCSGAPFKEEDKEPGEGRATSAYARTKALADDLALSFADRVPVIVARPTNCFGPWQHPEKAVARWATRALAGDRLPVWGDGGQVRDWMFVDDAYEGVTTLVERGAPGEIYNLAPEDSPRSNLEIARAIARAAGRDQDAVYLTAYDRPDHDRRYAIDASKARALGWKASSSLENRLSETVHWYRDNAAWWTSLVSEAERLYDDAAERTRVG